VEYKTGILNDVFLISQAKISKNNQKEDLWKDMLNMISINGILF
jgi:hypothetical protein